MSMSVALLSWLCIGWKKSIFLFMFAIFLQKYAFPND